MTETLSSTAETHRLAQPPLTLYSVSVLADTSTQSTSSLSQSQTHADTQGSTPNKAASPAVTLHEASTEALTKQLLHTDFEVTHKHTH